MIWGLLLILLGIVLLVNHLFGVSLPIVKLLFGGFLVWLGFKLIFSSFSPGMGGIKKIQTEDSAIFTESQLKYPNSSGAREFNVVFGRATLSLTGLDLRQHHVDIEVNAVFGSLDIYVDPITPISLESNVVFGDIRLPDGSKSVLGSGVFQLGGAESLPQGATERYVLKIRANSVFGKIRLIYP